MSECWQWNGRCLEVPPEGYFGFVYRIVNTRNGKIYIGKKQFTYSRKTKLSKKARVGTRKRLTTKTVDSKWLSYYGSSKELHEDLKKYGSKTFQREVLHFCENKSQLSYWEIAEQINHKVLFVDSYNNWISCKVFKRNLA